MKENLNTRLTGLASSVLREKMIVSILSDKFPSPQHCNMYSPETRGEGEEAGDNGELHSVTFLQTFLFVAVTILEKICKNCLNVLSHP